MSVDHGDGESWKIRFFVNFWEKLEIFHERLSPCHSSVHRDWSFWLQYRDGWNPPSYLEKWFWIPFSFLQVSDFLFWRAWFHRNSCSKIVYLENVKNKKQTIFQFNTLDMVCLDSEVILLYITDCRRSRSSKILIFQLFGWKNIVKNLNMNSTYTAAGWA